MRIRSIAFSCLAVAIFAAAIVRADLPFFTLAEVKPGQKGLGYTVVTGTEVKPFNVEVLGLIQNNAKDRRFILVKVSGTIFRDFSGIAAGMSGSPVFISGRLAGAISYAFNRSDPQYGLVTPIEDMLRLWERDYEAGGIALAPSSLLPAGCRTAFPVATPLITSGRRAPPEMITACDRYGLQVVAAAEVFGAELGTAPPLQPGSAISAVFALGDYNAVAIGTVTWIDGRRFLAFGHPVANRGAVDYPAAGAYIHRIINSQDMPFKIGAPLNRIGRIVQDRGAGASGLLDQAADTISVKAVVQDKSSGARRTYQSVVVQEPALLRGFCLAAMLDAIDRTLDEYASGTVRVTMRIEAEGLEAPLIRKNMFYSDKDIAAVAVSEVGEAIDLLQQNDFRDLRLRSLSLEVVFSPTVLAARVIRAVAQSQVVRPGEQLTVQVELQPYRQAVVRIPFSLTIPANARPGKLVLSIHGGFVASQNDEKGQGGFLDLFQTEQPANLAEYIALFTGRPRNNDLILEYLPLSPEPQQDGEEIKPLIMVQGCDFVVKGQTQITLEVKAEPQP